MNGFQCLMKCAFIPVGATVAAIYSLTVKQVLGLGGCRVSLIGFSWAKVKYQNIFFF